MKAKRLIVCLLALLLTLVMIGCGQKPAETPTPTPSASPSPTPSASPSPTPTPTPSATPSPTPSATPTSSETPTPSATPTPTPSTTSTPTPSATPSPTPSATPSPTPSVKPTAAPTASPSPTASPLPTPSASPSPAPSATPTAAPSAKPTTAPTASPSPAPSAKQAASTDSQSEPAGEQTEEDTKTPEEPVQSAKPADAPGMTELVESEYFLADEIVLDEPEAEEPVEVCEHEQLVYRVVREPSCTTAGAGEYVCKSCGAHVSTESIPAVGHSYAYTSDANSHWQVCSVCGNETAKAGHSFTDGKCTVCGYGCEHSFRDAVTAPTCTEKGFTTHTCTLCGFENVDSYTEATGHDFESKVLEAPTCTEAGVMEYTCANCGDRFTHDIEPAGHHPEIDPGVEPTCQSSGLSAGSHCSVCGTVLTPQKELPPVDHFYVDGVCIWCGAASPNDTYSFSMDLELPEIILT